MPNASVAASPASSITFHDIQFARAALAAHESSGLRVLFAAFVQDISDYDMFDYRRATGAARTYGCGARRHRLLMKAFFADLVAERPCRFRARSRRARDPMRRSVVRPQVWALWRRLGERHGVRVHCHALEKRAHKRASRSRRWPERRYARRRWMSAGLLDERLSLAHAIYTTPARARSCSRRRGVAVSHNPLSNLTLGSGILPLAAYLEAGVTVGIGTDASNCGGRHDMFEMMRLAQDASARRRTPTSRTGRTRRACSKWRRRTETASSASVIGRPGS